MIKSLATITESVCCEAKKRYEVYGMKYVVCDMLSYKITAPVCKAIGRENS